jgi:hypothetical protein
MDDDTRYSDATQDDPDRELEDDNEGMFHPEQEPHLAEDGARPAAPANDIPGGHVTIDDPQTDADMDSDELYQEGPGLASGRNVQHENSDLEERIVDEDDEDRNARIR